LKSKCDKIAERGEKHKRTEQLDVDVRVINCSFMEPRKKRLWGRTICGMISGSGGEEKS
jgi:hypothetical protein